MSMMALPEIKSRSKELFSMSLPMMVEHLALSIMGMISTMLVSTIGQYAQAALGMVDSISNLIIALFAALTTGGTIVVAQYIGRQDLQSAKRAGGQAVLLSAVLSGIMFILLFFFRVQILGFLFGDADAAVMDAALIFLAIVSFSFPVLAATQTIFGLLRGSGDTLTPMVISIAMNVVNLALGFVLIRGFDFGFVEVPSFGVAGAAIALLVTRILGMTAALLFIIKKARGIRLNRLRFFKPNPPMQKTILRLGMPNSIESGLFQGGRLITQIFIVWISTAAMATNTIAGSIVMFINVPGNALSIGAMILVGQRIGRGQESDVRRTALFATAAASVMFAALCFVMFFLQGPIVGLFSPSDEVLSYLPAVYISNLIATPLVWASAFVLPAALRATGDVVYPMIVSVSTMIVVRVALSYVFAIAMGMGVFGVWLAMYLDWVARSAFFIPRILGNKWRGKGISASKKDDEVQVET